MFIELNDKDAYCTHKSVKNINVFMNINTFMNMSQLKVTQIWNIRLNEYLKYWSLKVLKSVTITFYKLQMMRAFNFKKSCWSYIKWQNMQKYSKMKR